MSPQPSGWSPPPERIAALIEDAFRAFPRPRRRKRVKTADDALVVMGEQLRALWRLEDSYAAAGDARLGSVMEVAGCVASQIVDEPAASLDGLIAKALAVSWSLSGQRPSGEDFMEEGSIMDLATGIVIDLIAMAPRA